MFVNSLRKNFFDSSKFSQIELNNLKSVNEASKYNNHPNREGTPPIKNWDKVRIFTIEILGRIFSYMVEIQVEFSKVHLNIHRDLLLSFLLGEQIGVGYPKEQMAQETSLSIMLG